MPYKSKSAISILTFCLLFSSLQLASAKEDPVLQAALKELSRSKEQLKNQPVVPYFISYGITDTKSYRIVSANGALKNETDERNRLLDIDLRVGDYKFDNSHIIRGEAFSFGSGIGTTELPIESNEESIRQAIWFATDKYYKDAVEKYEKAVTNKAVKVAEEDSSADMSKEKAEVYLEDEKHFTIDKAFWKQTLNDISARFKAEDWIYQGDVVLNVEEVVKYLVNTEGTKLRWNEHFARIYVLGKTKAEDGMSLPLYESYFAFDPSNLPSKEKIKSDVEKMIAQLKALRDAPLMTTFSGPAILSGEASGVFFHEIFGHRVEGHREKDPNSSQTFKQQVGKPILPTFVDVIFDPTVKEMRGNLLSGYYKYDDEGVKAQKVVTVENGLFNSFLMSRNPIEGFPKSNGHGRRQAGNSAVSRQSNLIVAAEKTVSKDELRKMLIDEAKKQGKEYGLIFDQVQGGFTFTNRTIPNAFNVQPLVVYKVYTDGRPDELVRGVDLIGTPLATFANIIAAANDFATFNGVCGAESGGVPVSASSPSLLVSNIEVQKKKKSQAKLPVLPAPEQGGR